MSEPFIAEVRIFAGNFAPKGWAFCDGQVLAIAENTELFALLGTIYGGDGRTTFALPNLEGRAAMHPGSGPGLTSRRLGESLGAETVPLSETQMPSHLHSLNGASERPDPTPEGGGTPANNQSLSKVSGGRVYQNTTNNQVALASAAVSSTGGGQEHQNMAPYLTLNFIIALLGIFPSRS